MPEKVHVRTEKKGKTNTLAQFSLLYHALNILCNLYCAFSYLQYFNPPNARSKINKTDVFYCILIAVYCWLKYVTHF
jgi:hypothetical protein